MKFILYKRTRQIYYCEARKDVGAMKKGTIIEGLFALRRDDPIFDDWIINNNLNTKDFVVRGAYVPISPIKEIQLPERFTQFVCQWI